MHFLRFPTFCSAHRSPNIPENAFVETKGMHAQPYTTPYPPKTYIRPRYVPPMCQTWMRGKTTWLTQHHDPTILTSASRDSQWYVQLLIYEHCLQRLIWEHPTKPAKARNMTFPCSVISLCMLVSCCYYFFFVFSNQGAPAGGPNDHSVATAPGVCPPLLLRNKWGVEHL